jgi:hypothetical protein
MELFQAHNQWANRPADERFETLQDLYNASRAYANSAREKKVAISSIRTEAVDGNVQIVGKKNNPAQLTHWSFGQLAARVGAPAGYLRDLPATLAVQNLNHGLAHKAENDVDVNLLFHQNGGMLLRAFTSDKYTRIWNWEVAERLLDLQSRGWKPATPDMRFDGGDVAQCQMCHGTGKDCITCKGTGRAFPSLYASDHDMFAFVKNSSIVVKEPGSDDGLQRGVIVQNSEVGAGALKLTKFLYRRMCGNHIIWGASKVMDISVRHVGDARQRWDGYQAEIQKYADTGAQEDEQKIKKSRNMKIGDTKEEVLDKLFGMRFLNVPMKTLDAGYEAVVPHQDGDPNTVWGMVQGLTRHSQKSTYADQRTDIDRAAGKLMEADF